MPWLRDALQRSPSELVFPHVCSTSYPEKGCPGPGGMLSRDVALEAVLRRALGRAGIVRGWHRSYCLWLHAGRGSPENPGLMLALDRGGSCGGALFRIPAEHARAELLLAWRRELFTAAYHSRWVTVRAGDGAVRAVTFVANRNHHRYAGRLDDGLVVARLASAAGSLGSCAAYLEETLDALRSIGLRDRALERLQRLASGASP